MKFETSLLSLLTTTTDAGEEIFFAYLKELHEIPPPHIFWYPDRGSKGIAKPLWKEKKIRQWLLIGGDDEVREIWDTLLTTNHYTKIWEDNVEVHFRLQEVTVGPASDDDNFKQIAGVHPINPMPVLYRRTNYPKQIHFLVGEKSNCSFVQGYAYHSQITPMTPSGLLPENSLFNYLKDKVVAVYQPRGFYYDFRETSGSDGKAILEGFIQNTSAFREAHDVVIRTLDGETTLGTSHIDASTGKWQATIGSGEGQGQFLITRRSDGIPIVGEKYFLIGNISFNPSIVDTVFTDLYERQVYIGEESKDKYSPVESIRWDASVHPDTKQSEMELSDKITHILLSLGSDVIINDPYLLGDIREEDGHIKFTSQSQVIFINALMNAMAKCIIKNITIVGYWAKAKRFVEGDQEQFKANYKQLAILLQSTFANVASAKLNSFNLVLSKQTFHDRYWLSGAEESSTCYHVTNSTNGPFEQNELSIRLENELDSFKERTKIFGRMEEADTINLI